MVAQSPVAHATVPTPFLTPSAPSPIDDGGSFAATGLWAVAGSQLLLSMDRGDTWVQRTLVPGVSLDAASADVLSNVFILDATHLWTANPGPDSTVPYEGQGPGFDHLHVVVSRSTDGGATWQSVNIPGDWGGTQPVLAFANDQDGFLLLAAFASDPVAPSSQLSTAAPHGSKSAMRAISARFSARAIRRRFGLAIRAMLAPCLAQFST